MTNPAQEDEIFNSGIIHSKDFSTSSLGGTWPYSLFCVSLGNVHVFTIKQTFHCPWCNSLTAKKLFMLLFISGDGGRKERTCLCNIVSIGVNSLKRKHQQLQWKGRQGPFICLSVATAIFSHLAGAPSLWSSYGISGTGRFCFKVSMRDKTPLFTLVVTLLVTESAGGGGGRAFCEGGLATKHFWYRNCNRAKPLCNHFWSK